MRARRVRELRSAAGLVITARGNPSPRAAVVAGIERAAKMRLQPPKL